MERRPTQRCGACAYRGDRLSFPLPNDKPASDPEKPSRRAIFCVNGDCPLYGRRVDPEAENECEYFEEI